MRKLPHVLLMLLLSLGCATLVTAQVSFEARLTQALRVSSKLDVDVEIRSTGSSSFVLGTSAFLFDYNTAALGNPTKIAANDGPWDSNSDGDYNDVTLSSGTGYAGLTVLFGQYHADYDGPVVPPTFTRIGTVRLTILDPSQSSGLIWRGIGMVTEVLKLRNPGVQNGGQDPITFSGTFSDPGSAPLPIQMASFTASVLRDSDVEVTWRTVSETNNFGFEVYRKRNEDGEWNKLDFVQGHGTTLSAQTYSYIDKSVGFGKYLYRIKQIDLDGNSKTYPEMEVLVGVEPGKFFLAQNYPNPFNPSTLIEFVVPTTGHATMTLYNVLGQEVVTLFEGNAEAGRINTVRFSATGGSAFGGNASNLPSGLYFYTLRSAGQTETKRMLLMK